MTHDADQPCPHDHDAAALALHVLEPEEEIAVRTHLPRCRSCLETVRTTEQVMGVIGTAVLQIDPPARRRASILAQVATTAQDVPAEPPAQPNGDSRPRPARRERTSRPAGRGDTARSSRRAARSDAPRTGSRGRRLLVAISLTVAALLGFAGLTTYTVLVQQQRDAQVAQTQALADLLARAGRPGTARATLQTDTGQAVAVVLSSPTGPTVVAAGLPPNHSDTTTYVLWGINGASPQPLAAFDIVPGAAAYPLAATGGRFSAYAISLEPGRAMPTSPTTVVASGPVQV